MRVWQHLAAWWLKAGPEVAEVQETAAANPQVGKEIADQIRKNLQLLGLDLNTGKDLPESGLQQRNEKGFSFPVQPGAFVKAQNIGYIQIKGNYSEPLHESGPANAGKNITVDITIGYYFKKPQVKGGGKFMFETPAGQLELTFNEKGTPELIDVGQVADIGDAVENLIQKIVDEPPIGSESENMDIHEGKVTREQAEKAMEFKREKEQTDKAEAERTADFETHGGVEEFVAYMKGEGETTFGPGDLQKVLQNMFSNPNDRAFQRNGILKKIQEQGLTWDAGKKIVSSISPDDLVRALKDMADRIDLQESPSQSEIASNLSYIINRL